MINTTFYCILLWVLISFFVIFKLYSYPKSFIKNTCIMEDPSENNNYDNEQDFDENDYDNANNDN